MGPSVPADRSPPGEASPLFMSTTTSTSGAREPASLTSSPQNPNKKSKDFPGSFPPDDMEEEEINTKKEGTTTSSAVADFFLAQGENPDSPSGSAGRRSAGGAIREGSGSDGTRTSSYSVDQVTPKGAGEGGTLQKLSADADALGIYIKHLPARYTPVIAMNVLFANSRCLEDPEFMRLVREADPNYGLPNAEMKLASPPHEQQDRGPQLHKKVSKDSSAGSPAALASDDGAAPSVEHAAGTRVLPLQHPQQRKLSPSARSDEFLPPASDEPEIRYEQDCAAWWRSLIKACDFEEKPSNQQAVWPRDAQRAKVTSQWLDRNSPLYVPHLIVGQWSHLVARNPCPLTALGSDLHPIVRRILSVFTLNRCASLTAVRNVGFAFACMRTRPLLNRWAELMQQAQYAPWSEKKLILGLSRYASLEEMIRHFRESGTMENPSSFWFDKPKEHLREFVKANIRFWTPQPNRGGGGKAGGDRGGGLNGRMKPGGGPPLYQQNFSSREQNHNRAQALLDGRSAYDQQRGGARHVSDRYKEEYHRNYSYNGGRHQSREEMRHITGRNNYRDGYGRRDRTEGALRDCGRFGGSLDYERERFAPALGRDNYYRSGAGRGRGCSVSDGEADDDGYNWGDGSSSTFQQPTPPAHDFLGRPRGGPQYANHHLHQTSGRGYGGRSTTSNNCYNPQFRPREKENHNQYRRDRDHEEAELCRARGAGAGDRQHRKEQQGRFSEEPRGSGHARGSDIAADHATRDAGGYAYVEDHGLYNSSGFRSPASTTYPPQLNGRPRVDGYYSGDSPASRGGAAATTTLSSSCDQYYNERAGRTAAPEYPGQNSSNFARPTSNHRPAERNYQGNGAAADQTNALLLSTCVALLDGLRRSSPATTSTSREPAHQCVAGASNSIPHGDGGKTNQTHTTGSSVDAVVRLLQELADQS